MDLRMLFFSFLLPLWMLCAAAQNDQMDLQENGFLRVDLDEWQSEDSIFMEVKKKKEKIIAAPDYETVDNAGDEGSAVEKKEADLPTCLLCVCLSGSVYCEDVSPDMKSVPALPKETTYLYARFNKISKITNKDFAVGTLKRIDLTGNLISEIEDGAFSKLDQLEELTLAGNQLTKLPMLPQQLISLNANHNRLKTKGIRSSVLKKLKKLAYLYLGDNELEAIPPLPESLHVVHLHNNNITILTDETFCKGNDTHYIRYSMQEVRLDGNPIILAQHPNSFICLRSLPIGLYK
ncbi:osteoglycin, paralog b isoform X1 [Tachysurus fulvidraco]|uniref:osteoglycin, paralog b isoform X1 n=2 Tax=Tachysurus fulvidraco TaxID=1234273 RepID=UPI000F51670A|nr:osteoglycin, paralog b isoform X1 [Tachysurus fulvidraco]